MNEIEGAEPVIDVQARETLGSKARHLLERAGRGADWFNSVSGTGSPWRQMLKDRLANAALVGAILLGLIVYYAK